uniref:Uncharacterized protein n=1 Tax=Anguilla anguilla TaxID=7936 RepID=A0A0E9R2L3_ANGAN
MYQLECLHLNQTINHKKGPATAIAVCVTAITRFNCYYVVSSVIGCGPMCGPNCNLNHN